jgi:hypothetical protein
VTIDLAFWAGTAAGLLAAGVAALVTIAVTVIPDRDGPDWSADQDWLTPNDRELLDEEIA